MNRIAKLVDNALTTQGQERAQAMMELMTSVKILECEEGIFFGPIENALPKLATYLLEDNLNINGYTISIFRRVNISLATVTKLIELQDKHPHPLLVEALGLIDKSLWTTHIEYELTKALKNPRTKTSAAYALYCKSLVLKNENSIEELKNVALNENPQTLVFLYAINTLCILTQGHFCNIAKQAIKKVSSLSEIRHAKIAKQLDIFSKKI